MIERDRQYDEALERAAQAIMDAKGAMPYVGHLERLDGSLIDDPEHELGWLDGLWREVRAAQADLAQAEVAEQREAQTPLGA